MPGYDVTEDDGTMRGELLHGTDRDTTIDRRSFLKAGAALIAGAAASVIPNDSEAGVRDHDSAKYIAETKRMIESWYDRNKGSIYEQVGQMQSEYDSTGKTPHPFTKEIPVPENARKVFSSAKMEISYTGDVGENPTYKVQFLVSEKNGDIDCGSKTLTLRQKH